MAYETVPGKNSLQKNKACAIPFKETYRLYFSLFQRGIL